MVEEGEKMLFINIDGNEYDAEILAVEKDCFWWLVRDLKTVYQGNPDINVDIIEDKAIKFTSIWDFKWSLNEVYEQFKNENFLGENDDIFSVKLKKPIFDGVDDEKKKAICKRLCIENILLVHKTNC